MPRKAKTANSSTQELEANRRASESCLKSSRRQWATIPRRPTAAYGRSLQPGNSLKTYFAAGAMADFAFGASRPLHFITSDAEHAAPLEKVGFYPGTLYVS